MMSNSRQIGSKQQLLQSDQSNSCSNRIKATADQIGSNQQLLKSDRDTHPSCPPTGRRSARSLGGSSTRPPARSGAARRRHPARRGVLLLNCIVCTPPGAEATWRIVGPTKETICVGRVDGVGRLFSAAVQRSGKPGGCERHGRQPERWADRCHTAPSTQLVLPQTELKR